MKDIVDIIQEQVRAGHVTFTDDSQAVEVFIYDHWLPIPWTFYAKNLTEAEEVINAFTIEGYSVKEIETKHLGSIEPSSGDEDVIREGYRTINQLSRHYGIDKARCKQLVSIYGVSTRSVLRHHLSGLASWVCVVNDEDFREAFEAFLYEAGRVIMSIGLIDNQSEI